MKLAERVDSLKNCFHIKNFSQRSISFSVHVCRELNLVHKSKEFNFLFSSPQTCFVLTCTKKPAKSDLFFITAREFIFKFI